MAAIFRETSSQYQSTLCAMGTAIVTTKRIEVCMRIRVLGLKTEQIVKGTHKSRLGDFAPMSTNNLCFGKILILIKTRLVSSSLDPDLA